jgi:hypothetical protein
LGDGRILSTGGAFDRYCEGEKENGEIIGAGI